MACQAVKKFSSGNGFLVSVKKANSFNTRKERLSGWKLRKTEDFPSPCRQYIQAVFSERLERVRESPHAIM